MLNLCAQFKMSIKLCNSASCGETVSFLLVLIRFYSIRNNCYILLDFAYGKQPNVLVIKCFSKVFGGNKYCRKLSFERMKVVAKY